MQKELNQEGHEIYILGINHIDKSTANDTITANRDIPWLQDETEVDLWSAWEVSYRDVYLITPEGVLFDTINLSVSDLGNEENYNSLKETLLEI